MQNEARCVIIFNLFNITVLCCIVFYVHFNLIYRPIIDTKTNYNKLHILLKRICFDWICKFHYRWYKWNVTVEMNDKIENHLCSMLNVQELILCDVIFALSIRYDFLNINIQVMQKMRHIAAAYKIVHTHTYIYNTN